MHHIKNLNVVWGILIAIFALFVNMLIAQTGEQKPAPPIDTTKIQVDSTQIAKPDSMLLIAPDASFFEPDSLADSIDVKMNYRKFPPRIVLANGADYTQTPDVAVNIDAPYATHIKISNDETFPDIDWGDALSETTWKLRPENGDKTVYLKAFYPDSTESVVVSDNIKLVEQAPIPAFTIVPDSGIAGETEFSVDAAASRHTYELFFRWDWENDGRFDTYWSLARKEKHIYKNGGGKVTVNLEVKDSAGWRVEAARDITVYSRPKAIFVVNQEFDNPYNIQFNAINSTDYEDGDNILIRWNFDADSLWDTKWSDEKVIEHHFGDFQTTTVMLQVKDSDGITATFERTIENRFRDMVFVPAGDFSMGSDAFELDERPIHNVYLDDYWIDKYPVTNEQYAAFLNNQKPDDADSLIDLGDSDTKISYDGLDYVVLAGFEKFPVVHVTWYGAVKFAESQGKSLPTEAEWEKAARSNDGRLYPWGEQIDSSRANYWDSGDPFDNNLTPIGFYDNRSYKNFQTIDSQGPYGTYDMVGNVREWCADWYAWNFYRNAPVKNPTGPKAGNAKVVRGGGYLFHPDKLRATFRSSYEPETTNSYIGFRCVIRKH